MAELVLTEDRGAVRHVVLNRPEKRNAFNGDLVLAVGDALRAAPTTPASTAWCCAARARCSPPAWTSARWPTSPPTPEQLRPFRRAVPGGLEPPPRRWPSRPCARSTAPASAARSSSRSRATCASSPPTRCSGMPETRIGLIPDVGGSSRLPQVVGLGRAKELIMTGKLIGGEEAERIGLANRVAPAEELEAATQTLVDELLACAPVAVGLAKRVMDASARPALAATLELEVAMQELLRAHGGLRRGHRRVPREARGGVQRAVRLRGILVRRARAGAIVAMRILMHARQLGHVTPLARRPRAPAGTRCWSPPSAAWRPTSSAPGCRSPPSTARPRRSGARSSPRRSTADIETAHARMIAEYFGRMDTVAALPGLAASSRTGGPDVILRDSWEFASTLVAAPARDPARRVGLGLAVGRGGRRSRLGRRSTSLARSSACRRRRAGARRRT